MSEDDKLRIEKWEGSGNFARDVFIALLWQDLEWYERLCTACIKCDDASEKDGISGSVQRSARLSLAFEDLGMQFFDALAAHISSDESYIHKAEVLRKQTDKVLAERDRLRDAVTKLYITKGEHDLEVEKAEKREQKDEGKGDS